MRLRKSQKKQSSEYTPQSIINKWKMALELIEKNGKKKKPRKKAKKEEECEILDAEFVEVKNERK